MFVLPISRPVPRNLATPRSAFARTFVILLWLLWFALAPAVDRVAQAQGESATPAQPAVAAAPAALAAPDIQTVTVPGMQTPNGLAVHGVTRRIYVTSRDNGMVYMLDPSTYQVLAQATVGALPWGVAVDYKLNRVYVANFGGGTLTVLDAATLARVATINLGAGAQPTFVGVLPDVQRVFIANHGTNTVAVINSATNTLEKLVKPGDTGAWGLAVSANLNRVYVSFRETATLVTLDAAYGWQPRPGATIQPCGRYPAAPYGLAFSENTSKLYVACAPAGNVNTAVVYQATTSGLVELRRNSIASGGANGGGVAVSLASGNAFFTNSASGNVSIIGHPSNQLVGTEPVGRDPFAVAVDFVGGRVIVGNRADNTLSVFADPYLPAAYKVNGLAVNLQDGKVFATSRENNLLLRLKGNGSVDLDTFVIVGRQPWGVAVNPRTDRVYVADFADGDVRVLQASTLNTLAAISVGGEPTFVEVDATANRVFTVSHKDNALVVINAALNMIEKRQPTGGDGAFGLAFNPRLNRVYIGHRGSGDLMTMDGATGWQPITAQRISACGAGRSPYALAFNPTNDRLYVACATGGSVDTAAIYRADATGLTRLALLPLQAGGADGGGGIAVNPTTGNVFFTNSEAGTVSIVNDSNQLAGTPVPVGLDPFGLAADSTRGFVYVGLRLGNDVVVLKDTGGSSQTGPRLFLSRQDGCQGVPLTVFGAGFTASAGRTVEVRMDGILLVTAAVDSLGAFMAPVTLPGPASPGGTRTIRAADPGLPAVSASAALRTPRTDLPVIFMGGIAGSRLFAEREFQYEIPPYNWFGDGDVRTYRFDEEVWLGTKSIDQALFGNDYHFYPLRLDGYGLNPLPDIRGRLGYLWAKEPVYELVPPLGQPVVDVYRTLYNRMQSMLSVQGRALYDFGYDWRKDLNVSAPLLEQKINAVLQATGKDKVVLVGHSMGGMLARHYLLKYGAGKVDQVITFGTPYLGSVHPAKYLEMGDTMGMEADVLGTHHELNPDVVKEMAFNYGGLYQMLPARLWFNRSPFDGSSYDPRYLGLANWVLKEGLITPTYTPRDITLLTYDQTKSYLAHNYNPILVEQGDQFTAEGVGDLTRMTDQYINQRIIGTGTPTWGHLWTCQRPCTVCTKNLWDDGYTCKQEDDVPAVPILDTLGDDTVPLRSGAASEPLSKMLQDGHYYFVNQAHHMTLGADVRVQELVLGLLRGDFCTNQQVLPPGNGAGTAAAAALTPDTPEADYAALGTTTGVQITVLGDASLEVTDAAGRRLSASGGLLAGYAGSIPGGNLVSVQGAQVAALTTGGPFTVSLRGTADGGAARVILSNLETGVIVRSVAFPGIPVMGTTTASLQLAAAQVEPDTVLAYRYTPDRPEQTLTGAVLDGETAGDTTPPAVRVTQDVVTGLVSITADDGVEGSAVMQVLYSGEAEPAHFLPYEQPFAWPANAGCVTGLAVDRAGNTGVRRLCRSVTPLLLGQ